MNKKIKYVGQHGPPQTIEVSEEDAKELLKRPDYEEVIKSVPRKRVTK